MAALPAITLRAAPVELFGSGIGVESVPLAKVEQAWPQAGSDRRIVFVP